MYLKLSYKKSILSGVQDLAHAVRKLAVINRLLFQVSSGIVELLTSCSNYRYIGCPHNLHSATLASQQEISLYVP